MSHISVDKDSDDFTVMDGMILFGLSGDSKKYNECSKLFDKSLAKQIIEEYGIEEALKERLVTQEEIDEYLKGG